MDCDTAFNKCVELLDNSANKINKWFPSTKMDYNKINVLVFCVIWPAITVALIATIIALVAKPGLALAIAQLVGLQ